MVTEQGRFNLQDVADAPPGAVDAAGLNPAPLAASANATATASAGLPLDFKLGVTKLSNGRIGFTDRFVPRLQRGADRTQRPA